MQAITRTARVMALDITGLENKFRLPRSGSDQALLIAASAFATDARPLKAEFIRHEMDASFIEDMEAEIDALQHAISTQNTGRGAHVSATISLDAQTERGLIAARKLHAILRNKFRDDPPALAAWESARHVERVARQRKHANGGATAPVPGGDKRS
jgi:hypothetical protein